MTEEFSLEFFSNDFKLELLKIAHERADNVPGCNQPMIKLRDAYFDLVKVLAVDKVRFKVRDSDKRKRR